MKPQFIPGTNIPVYYVDNIDDVRQMANEMKINAVQQKLDKPCEYSNTLKELEEKVKSLDSMKLPKLAVAMVYQKQLYSLILTCEKQDSCKFEEVWHLSIGQTSAINGLPEKLNEEVAKFILTAFFEEYSEVGPFGVLSQVRHFIAPKTMPENSK